MSFCFGCDEPDWNPGYGIYVELDDDGNTCAILSKDAFTDMDNAGEDYQCMIEIYGEDSPEVRDYDWPDHRCPIFQGPYPLVH